MNRRQRRRLEQLERRQRALVRRIADYRADGDPSYLRAELAAIGWAVDVIRAADRAGVLDELEPLRGVTT